MAMRPLSSGKVTSGNQAVSFNENGHLMYPGQPTRMQPERAANVLDWRNNPGVPGFRPLISSDLPFYRYSTPISNSGDRLGQSVYSEKTPMVGAAKKAEPPAIVVVEEMKVYNEPPCCWGMYLIVGLCMTGVGVANVLFCFDHHAFCYLWTGFSLLAFTIICGVHGGEYWEKTWKSVLTIVVGFLTTAFVMTSFYLVLVSFCRQSIEIAQFTPDFYISIQKYRYNYYKIGPILTLNADWMYNIWVGFSLDALGIVLLTISLGVLTTTMFVVDRFFNSHYVINRMVDPFCEPCLFNPWSQASLGQAMIVIGAAVGGCHHGIGKNTSWFLENAPVWAGISPIFGGIVAALGLKYCGDLRRSLVWFGVLAEFQSLVTSSVAVVFTSMLLSDNITTLINGGAMIVTSWGRGMVVASSLFECLADLICIVNVFYSLSLLIRLLACLCTKWYHAPDDEIRTNDKPLVKTVAKNDQTRPFGGQIPLRTMNNAGVTKSDQYRVGSTQVFNM